MKKVLHFTLTLYVSVAVVFFNGYSQSNQEVGLMTTLPHLQNSDFSILKRFKVGDVIPLNKINIHSTRNYGNKSINLGDFKGKYIILDFWTKYCSSCIESFPKMEALQKKFGKNLQIILLTENTEKELSRLFEVSFNVSNTSLPIGMGDTLITKIMFPHYSVPYLVWIDPNGKVVATTVTDETTDKNVEDLVNGKSLNVLIRKDDAETNMPGLLMTPGFSLMRFKDGYLNPHIIYYSQYPTPIDIYRLPDTVQTRNIQWKKYYSMFMDFIPDFKMSQRSTYTDSTGHEIGLRIANSTLEYIMSYAYHDSTNNHEAIAKVFVDSSCQAYFPQKMDSTTQETRFESKTTFSYESSLPNFTFNKGVELLKQDIRRCFGIVGRVEYREIPCLILISAKRDFSKYHRKISGSTTSFNEIVLRGKDYELRNISSSQLALFFTVHNKQPEDLYVINESGMAKDYRFSIKFPKQYARLTSRNIDDVRELLIKYGFDLKIENRFQKVLIISSAFPSKS